MNTSQQITHAGSRFVTCGLHRPNWLTALTRQLVFIVADNSCSMTGQKISEALAAMLALVAALADQVNKSGFYVGVISFAEMARQVHAITKASDLNGKIVPLIPGGNGTNIHSGIELALKNLEMAEVDPPEKGVTFLRPVVLVYSDGQHNTGPAPQEVAEKLKAKADLVTVAFGADADEKLLKALATSEQHFHRCRDGSELRQFLATVGDTICQTRAAGMNATQALSQLAQ